MDRLSDEFDVMFGDVESELGGSNGFTREEIRGLASRLKVGEEFRSFEEFDLAIDCWGLINGRPCQRVKTQKEFRLRVCREGSRMVTRKGVVDYAECAAVIIEGNAEESFASFEAFTQGHHVRTGPTGHQNVRMARNGRCGERLRYPSAGEISRRGMNGSAVSEESLPATRAMKCHWRVKAKSSSYGSGVVIVTVCNLQHTCPTSVSKWRGQTSRSKFLARIMGGKISVDLNARVRNLQEDMRLTYGEVTVYSQMWRAREVCREQMNCNNAFSFHLIPELLTKMKAADPDCVIDWEKFHGTDIFCRAFVCPGASRTMYLNCQRVIALDACHTKNRKFPCQIFLASALDGNKEAVILCYAVAHTEDTDTWTWFCQNMKELIQGIDKDSTVIISDRQKGLAHAVDDVFEDILHGNCAHHLLMNLQSRFGKPLAANFSKILYASSPERFERHLQNLEGLGDKGQEMADYLREADPWRWARCLFPLPRYGRTTSNLAESLNSALLPVRYGTAFKVIHDIWYYMQQAITSRREKLRAFSGSLTPYAQRRFTQNERYSRGLICLVANETEASVTPQRGRCTFLVKRLDDITGTCGCAEYQEMVWPCSHGIAFERELGNSLEDRFDHVWQLSSLRSLYEHRYIPPLDLIDPTADFTCTAPAVAVRRGRHRVLRIPNNSRNAGGSVESTESAFVEVEFDMTDTPLVLVPGEQAGGDVREEEMIEHTAEIATPSQQRFRRPNMSTTVRCGLCKQLGHNRRTCSSISQLG